MEVDTYSVLCRGYPVFHCEQHIRDHVQQHGHVQGRYGDVYQPSVSSVGHQAPLEPVCGHNQDQEMVDYGHADNHVCGLRSCSLQPSSSFC